eukprot:CAMPEP_0201940118 /NCGR_PEP_ID=MMETSP0903-20130614/44612_1 /ASSEMBLY_ACC=CAM_ASM_000552 /TAXON_ID=420261 /ORGANISM="Thalassiosira antarctica, Strain CCMP982" /LENGTH=34 /DNA_ID= /DNA_START= /DNA_END= /DNA_ORIENTATION=
MDVRKLSASSNDEGSPSSGTDESSAPPMMSKLAS